VTNYGSTSLRQQKFRRTFVPRAKRPGSIRAWERKFQGMNWPWSKKVRERKGQGAKVSGSELARVLLAVGPVAKRLSTRPARRSVETPHGFNIPDIFRCNLRKHFWIFIMFGTRYRESKQPVAAIVPATPS